MVPSIARLMLAICLSLLLVTKGNAEEIDNRGLSRADQQLVDRYGPDYPIGPDPQYRTPLTLRLKQDPNDAHAIRKYSNAIVQVIEDDSDFQSGTAKLDELETFLDALPGETSAAKAAIAGARTAVATGREIIAIRETPLDVFQRKVVERPDDAMSISLLRDKMMQEIPLLAHSAPDKAAKQLEVLTDLFNKIDKAVPADTSPSSARWQLNRAKGALAELDVLIQASQKQSEVIAKLIGNDAAPLDVEAWVNGYQLDVSAFPGKLTLIHFCSLLDNQSSNGLPHLAKWQADYAKHGLEIIVVTRYHNALWDEVAERPYRLDPRAQRIPNGAEQLTVAKFAQHHKLPFRFTIQNDLAHKKLLQTYGGFELPRTVIIDQNGKVRLIRAGEGKYVTADIESKLTELLARRRP